MSRSFSNRRANRLYGRKNNCQSRHCPNPSRRVLKIAAQRADVSGERKILSIRVPSAFGLQ
jgi:hypothetical protein